MKFSIIIPTYLEQKVIAGALLQFQACKEKWPLEIIVADGASADRTAELAGRYGDRVVVEGKRKNISSGRNLGAQYASGDIMVFLDADVRIPDPDGFFAALRDIFAGRDNVSAVIPALQVYPRERTLQDAAVHAVVNAIIRASGLAGIHGAKGECQVVRSDVFRAVGGYDEKLVTGEDSRLILMVARHGRVVYPRKLVVYHSPRRFRARGYLKYFVLDWFLNTLSLALRGKPYVTEWKPVR